MRKSAGFAWAAMLVLLVACSSVIPPQVAPNPLGIAGKEVQVEIGATALTIATTTGLGVVKSNFSDIDTSQVPIALNLSQSLFKIGFAADTRLETSAAPLPCAIILTRVDISVTLKDDQRNLSLPTFHVNKLVELQQREDNPNTYTISTPEVFVGNVLSGPEVKQLQEIITTGGDNRAEVRVVVQATSVPDLPPGSRLIFTFNVAEATLVF